MDEGLLESLHLSFCHHVTEMYLTQCSVLLKVSRLGVLHVSTAACLCHHGPAWDIVPIPPKKLHSGGPLNLEKACMRFLDQQESPPRRGDGLLLTRLINEFIVLSNH